MCFQWFAGFLKFAIYERIYNVLLIEFKEIVFLVQITKEQALYLRERYPSVNIVKTCSGKHSAKRGKRYVENNAKVRSLLYRYANEQGGKVIYDSRTQRK